MEDDIQALTEELSDVYEELSILYEMTERMRVILNCGEIMRLTLEKSQEIIQAQNGFIITPNKRANKWEIFLVHPENHPYTLSSDLVIDIVQTMERERRTIIVEDPTKTQSLISPLMWKEEILGIVVLRGKKNNQEFTARDRKLLDTLSMVAGISLENAKVFKTLSAEKKELETIIDNVNDGLMAFGPDKVIVWWNSIAVNLLSIEEKKIYNKKWEEIFSDLKDKKILNFMLELERSHQNFLQKEANINIKGEILYLRLSGIKLYNEENEILLFILILENLTDTVRAQKIAVWQDVARKLAHELKNPLTPIRLNAEALRDPDLQNKSNFKEMLNNLTTIIIQEVDRLKELVEEFHNFGRLPAPRLELKNIQEILQEVLLLYQNLSPNTRMEANLNEDLPLIHIDSNQIKQVFINLIKNALEAMPEGGTISINANLDTRADNSKWVKIEISDTGTGIPFEVMEKIFEPYFTTKKTGSGLGLSLVHKIITDHQGEIKVKSIPRKGTTFSIYFPVGYNQEVKDE